MIIFGSAGREEPRGIVADMCPTCQIVRAFAVLDSYEVPHVYWVKMGKGTHRGTFMRCLECRTNCTFESRKYTGILDPYEAERSNLEDLIRRTHPEMANGGVTTYWQCSGCGFQREQPFRFCPQCGARIVQIER